MPFGERHRRKFRRANQPELVTGKGPGGDRWVSKQEGALQQHWIEVKYCWYKTLLFGFSHESRWVQPECKTYLPVSFRQRCWLTIIVSKSITRGIDSNGQNSKRTTTSKTTYLRSSGLKYSPVVVLCFYFYCCSLWVVDALR